MEKLECIIVHRSLVPLVPVLSFKFGLSLTCHPDNFYYFSDVRDGEIVRKRSRLLNPFKHVVVQQ